MVANGHSVRSRDGRRFHAQCTFYYVFGLAVMGSELYACGVLRQSPSAAGCIQVFRADAASPLETCLRDIRGEHLRRPGKMCALRDRLYVLVENEERVMGRILALTTTGEVLQVFDFESPIPHSVGSSLAVRPRDVFVHSAPRAMCAFRGKLVLKWEEDARIYTIGWA